jgi:hypothetical protein
VERLVALEWTEESIAIALALPARQVRKLRLLANIHPAMLDQMAKGDMPQEGQLRAIAAASQEEQAQVWKKFKPKKADPHVIWPEVARALSKRRIEAKFAKFDDDLAAAYGIVWQEDLFTPVNEDGRYTTDVEAFFGAQQEWLANHLPARGIILELDQWGGPKLPPKAERLWGKPGKGDQTGWYIDQRSGDVGSIAYRLPQSKRTDTKACAGDPDSDTLPVRTRPEVSRKGVEMIGDLRTDALHEAFRRAPIEEDTLLALLVLAFAGSNVTVATGNSDNPYGRSRCEAIAARLIGEEGLVAGREVLVTTAREMLIEVMSCREGRSSSGVVARVAGGAIGADSFLPNMATEDFLSCLSRTSLEASLEGTSVLPRNKVKDTRKALVEHYAADRFLHPAALFPPRRDVLTAWRGRHGEATGDAEETQEADADPGDGEPDRDDVAGDPECDYPVAAE